MEITNLRPEDEAAIAEIVVEAFRGHTPAWPDTAAALEEVAGILRRGPAEPRRP